MFYRLALDLPNLEALACTFGPIFNNVESALKARSFLECSGKAKYPVMVVNLKTP
jgi:hypothetical protein